ncbi:MAG: GspH/FimT family pseudopilin [Hyphomonas sp.]
MMPAPATPDGRAGFSLMELMVALTILALAMTVVSLSLTRRSPGFEVRRASADVSMLLRDARASAQEQNRMVRVVFLPEARRFEGDAGQAVELPLSIEASLVSSAAAGQAGLIFLPDGSSTGGTITLSAAGLREQVEVDWLTSRIDRRRPE